MLFHNSNVAKMRRPGSDLGAFSTRAGMKRSHQRIRKNKEQE